MKKFEFPKLFARKKKKKIRASVRRASASGADFDDAGEPNMKLSRALLIVLVLHIVAVAGIIAFNAIKSRQGTIPIAAKTQPAISQEAKLAATPLPKKSKSSEPESSSSAVKYYIVAKGDKPASIAKKFKVSSEELLAANHIEDPHKLQVGQKILIPKKNARTKKSEE